MSAEAGVRGARLTRATDILATVGALLVIPVIAVEVRATDPRWILGAAVANWVIWLVFLADAGANLYAEGKQWLRRRSAWLDVAVIVASFPYLPMVLASARLARTARVSRAVRAARAGRAVRVLRLVRLAILVTRAYAGLQRILDPAAFPFVAMAVGLVVVTGGLAFQLYETSAESISLGDAMWWAVTTVTTVGYGDLVPRSASGRLIAVIVMVVGITFTSLLTAQVAAHVTGKRQAEENAGLRADLAALDAKIDRLGEELRRARARGPESAAAGGDEQPSAGSG